LETDAVVVAVGIQPQDKLAEDAGLEVDQINGGVVVSGHFLILLRCRNTTKASHENLNPRR